MKILFLLLVISILVFGSLAVVSCSNSESRNENTGIPEEIQRRAEQIVISKTGKDFFTKYITPDHEESKTISQGYFISYRFYMPERPYVDEKISFVLDSTGNLRKDMEVTGVPDCNASPENCSFLIDEMEARKIAEDAGLQKGIKEWGTAFMWNTEYNKYVWHVLTTLNGSDGPDGFRGSGTELIIDSNSGEILKTGEWNIR